MIDYKEIFSILADHDSCVENALVLYLDILFHLTKDDTIKNAQKKLFESSRKEHIEKLKGELQKLENKLYWHPEKSQHFIVRKIEIENQIAEWQSKTYNEEKDKMATRIMQTDSLTNLIDRLVTLKLRANTYSEFDAQVPELLLKEIRNLKRDIATLVEVQKDNQRDEIKAALRETETVAEKRERLEKELSELGKTEL